MQRKAMSTVVSSILMILLVMIAAVTIWSVVKPLVDDNIKESEACFNIFEEVTINGDNTCNNVNTKLLEFSIALGDIEVDELYVSISDGTNSQTLILGEHSTINYLQNYSSGNLISLPSKNGEYTYYYDYLSAGLTKPTNIKIAPVIDEVQCEVTDTQNHIIDCF